MRPENPYSIALSFAAQSHCPPSFTATGSRNIGACVRSNSKRPALALPCGAA